ERDRGESAGEERATEATPQEQPEERARAGAGDGGRGADADDAGVAAVVLARQLDQGRRQQARGDVERRRPERSAGRPVGVAPARSGREVLVLGEGEVGRDLEG